MFLNPMKLLKPKIGLVFAALLLSSAAEAAPPGEGWALGWSDEFDGTALNGSNWTVGTGNRRDAVNTANALSVQDGYLRIKTYTEGGTHYTGWIGSQGKYENCFGYWEARVRYRSSQGMWSAFWLQPYGINSIGDPAGNGTEIDIAEHRSRDSGGANLTNSLAMNVHWDGYGASHQSVGSTVGNPGANPASLQGNFHTYGLLWEPGRYRFYIDGVEVWTTTAAISQVRQWIYLTSEVDNGAWAGPTPGSYGDRSSTSTYQDIDYVRFYQRAEQTVNGAFSNRMGPWRQIGTASLAATGGRNGGAGARMNPSNTSGGRVAQKVAGLLPNTPYVVRGWGNVGSRTWPDVRIGARDYGGAETFASIWSNGFTAAEKVFVTGASNSTADVFAWVPTQYGDCHADDIEIRRAGRFTNGGFESGDGSHWAPYGDTLVQSWGGVFRRSGTSALRLNANAAARGAEHAVYGLKPATAYTLSVWAKGNGQPVRLGVKNHGGADAFSTVTGAGGNWTKGSHSFTTGATHTSATLYAYAAAGSSVAAVDLDDFVLLEALPPAWTSTKIGPGHPGEAGLSDGRVIVRGSGNNLGTASDGLQFVHQPMAGDGKVTAKLNSFEAAHNRAKAGLMMRASTAVDAPFAMVHWMTEGQCEFIWRNSAGTAASYVWAAGTTAWPPQLRLVRSGNLVTASFSTNGSTWTQIGATQAIDLPANLLAGLAVSSHEPDDSGEAVFSNFSFTGDRDGDGLPDDDETNTGTYVSPTNTGTDPDVPDTDGDGFPDGAEVLNGTNPLVPNTELIWQPGAAPGGSGNWDSLASTWRVGSGPTAWIPGKTALFGGTAGTVGIGSGIAGIGGLVFNTSGYVLDGSGPLVLAPEAGIALNAASTSILTPLSGSSTLNITGGVAGSQLQLRGNSSGFSGALVIDGNAQIRAYNTATGSATGSELGGPESTAEIRAGSQLRWFNLAGSPTYPLNFHLSGGGIAGGNAGALNHDSSTARTITLSGAITLDAPATIGTQNNGSWVINGPLSGEHALTMLLGAANSSINGPTDLAALVKSGGATLVLGGEDLRIGSTTVAGGDGAGRQWRDLRHARRQRDGQRRQHAGLQPQRHHHLRRLDLGHGHGEQNRHRHAGPRRVEQLRRGRVDLPVRKPRRHQPRHAPPRPSAGARQPLEDPSEPVAGRRFHARTLRRPELPARRRDRRPQHRGRTGLPAQCLRREHPDRRRRDRRGGRVLLRRCPRGFLADDRWKLHDHPQRARGPRRPLPRRWRHHAVRQPQRLRHRHADPPERDQGRRGHAGARRQHHAAQSDRAQRRDADRERHHHPGRGRGGGRHPARRQRIPRRCHGGRSARPGKWHRHPRCQRRGRRQRDPGDGNQRGRGRPAERHRLADAQRFHPRSEGAGRRCHPAVLRARELRQS
jgi:beta-glucanase (GH16 family)